MANNGALVPLGQGEVALVSRLRESAGTYALAIQQAQDHLERSVLCAAGIKQLRAILTDHVVIDYVLPLANSPLGFLTDRDPARAKPGQKVEPYPIETIRECVIAALLAGLRLVGNEFNVIAGRLFVAKDGWRRLTCEAPGVTDAEVIVCEHSVERETLFRFRCVGRCRVRGEPVELLDAAGKVGRTIEVVKKYDSDSLDTLRGKAERRAWMALHHLVRQRLSRESVLPAADEGEVIEGQPATSGLNQTVEQAAPPAGDPAGGTEPTLTDSGIAPSRSDQLAAKLAASDGLFGQPPSDGPYDRALAAGRRRAKV